MSKLDFIAMAVKTKKAQTKAKVAKPDPLAGDEPRFIADEDGKIIYATNGLAKLIGQAEEKIAGQAIADIIDFEDPDDALRTQNMFGVSRNLFIDALIEGDHDVFIRGGDTEAKSTFRFDKIATGEGRNYIVGAQTSGKTKATKTRQKQLTDSILALLGPAPDKSGKSKTKITEKSDEGELRHFLNMSNEVMAISFRDGKFSRVNPAFNETLGYSDDELRGMSFIDLVYADDRPHVRNSLRGIMLDETSDGQIIDIEARLVGKDGNVKWMELRQKRGGDMIYTVGRDVTAIKSHEKELTRQEQMLGEAQAIGHMGHWHWTVGAEDIVWSDEIYRIFGVEKDSFTPTLDNVNAMLHRRDIGRLMQAFQRAIIEQNNYEMEFRAIRPDDGIRYIRCQGKCELDDDGDVIALFGIMQDITERTLYEQQLKEAKDSAERAYAAKTQFLANMSHELRTPLNAIIGFSEMMQRQLLGPIGTEKYLDYIGGIRQSGEHLLDLISDILDMSKIEAGKYELDLEEINAVKIIRLAVHMVEGRAQDARIKITIDAPNEDLQIIADRRAFMQVLLNILSNAVKFTEPGGDVRVECIEREDYVSIKVHDTGIGIPANKIACITNPFEQAASHYTREHEGTGLGLAITKELVELHGGSLHIDSTVGIGTSVTVRLPYDTHEALKRKARNA